MNASEFRAELVKIMPGYKWTVHKSHAPEHYLLATGTQSSGSNRLSTLQVERRDNYAGSGLARYEVKSSGYGKRAPWLHTVSAPSLAVTLRCLEHHYETMARLYSKHASDLQVGRLAKAGAR